jgi:hypothetical protein
MAQTRMAGAIATAEPAPRWVLLSPAIQNRLHRLVQDLFDPYRPELHYMRGPGPKWRAKHGLAPLPADCRSIRG